MSASSSCRRIAYPFRQLAQGAGPTTGSGSGSGSTGSNASFKRTIWTSSDGVVDRMVRVRLGSGDVVGPTPYRLKGLRSTHSGSVTLRPGFGTKGRGFCSSPSSGQEGGSTSILRQNVDEKDAGTVHEIMGQAEKDGNWDGDGSGSGFMDADEVALHGSPEERLAHFVQRKPSPVTLRELTRFGKTPLSPEALIQSAEYARVKLPHRLARRVKAHRSLPFIVGTNPYISKIYKIYENAFYKLASVPPIRTVEDNDKFTEVLAAMVEEARENIPILARGFQESKRYMSEEEISTFLNRAIRNRIAIRLIAEQHISQSAMSSSSSPFVTSSPSPSSSSKPNTKIGIIDTECSPLEMIQMCGRYVTELCEGTLGRSPELIVDGERDARFHYVPVHLEYILTELLKNAFRATVEHHADQPSSSDLPPVIATISTAGPSPAILSLRIRDQGGGIDPRHLPNVFSYSFSTVKHDDDEEDGYSMGGKGGIGGGGGGGGSGGVFEGLTKGNLQNGLGTIAGLGYGLPMSRLYAAYFGGSLDLVSMWGHGTDVFCTLRHVED